MGEADDFALWQARVAGTNISPTTLLATDYLNHFNEIIMMLGMVADMPDLLDECREWRPKGYQEHFAESGFSDRDLAIAAYDQVPERYRRPFEETIEQMNGVVATVIEQLDETVAAGDLGMVSLKAQTATQLLQQLLDHASAIIHGSERTMNQGEVDALLGR